MEENIKLTCLHEEHIALGAKMSPFAGFDMPIQYSGITDEHLAVRQNVGMFDVSHMGEVFISGTDAEKFVNHIFTNEVKGMPVGKILYGMMCYPDGGVVDDLLVYKYADKFLLVINAANIDKDYAWMLENAKGYDVRIDNQSDFWGQIAVQGPKAEEALCSILPQFSEKAKALGFYEFFQEGDFIISRTGYTGEDGFEVYTPTATTVSLWKQFLGISVAPCGLGCRDTLRFEAGLPLYGDELSAEISPVEAGLSMFCKFDKDEFIGKDALADQKANGTVKKLVGIEIEDKAIPRAGYPVELEDGTEIGVVTTGYHSISLDKSICFALVKTEFSKLGTPLWIHIRKKTFPGVVVKKRFYQTNYKK